MGKWHKTYGVITQRLIDLYRYCGLILDPLHDERMETHPGRDQFLAHLVAYGEGPVQKALIPKAIAYPGTLWGRADRDSLVGVLGDAITNRDSRPPRKYAAGLVWGWQGEDLVAELWTARGVRYERLGCDWPRRLLGLSKLDSQPDFLVTLDSGRPSYIEVHQDHTGHYGREGTFHLRPGILDTLTKATDEWPQRSGGVIGLDVLGQRYFKLPVSRLMELSPRYKEKHPGYGGRPVYEVRIGHPRGDDDEAVMEWYVTWHDARKI